MKLKDMFRKNNTNEKFVKLKCVDKAHRIYVLEALCDFEICGKHIIKGDISGRIVLKSTGDSFTLKGKNWLQESATLMISGKCALENSFFYAKNWEIFIKNSSITNSYIYVQDGKFVSPKIDVVNSKIEDSKFIIITTLSGSLRNILVSSSNLKNCNFYTAVIPPEPLFNVDYLDSIAQFEIKNSVLINTTSLKDVSVINSKINEDGYAEKVYVEGEFFVKDSEVRFTTEKACIEFPHIPYYSAGYLKKNLTAKKYTKFWSTKASGYSYVETYDENEKGICMKFGKIEPEILESYNFFKVKEDRKRQARKSESDGINILADENVGDDILQVGDDATQQKDKESAVAQATDAEIERNKRFEELKKKAKELGIEL